MSVYSVTNDQWMMCFLSSAITRKQYKQFLKKCYRQSLPDDDKLLTTASKYYIELAVISKEGVTSKQADEFTRKSLHGLAEEILRQKAPIELKHILKPREDGRPVRCVLVEGAPGIGKSTLAWEVCHKWEELESVKQYELVVLVRLREKKAQEARCLGDLLPCDATTKIKELLSAIGKGEGMLIVCDGFDELPHEQRQEGSVYIDLLKGRLLSEATVIVTSRPSVSAGLWSLCQHNIDRHLEVIGFTKEDIKQFAESVFSGDILAGFLSYITSIPPIYSMMYIPLNAVIVALIYQDSYGTDTPFPTTMTQLFDALTRALIRRHLVSTHQVPSEYCMPPSLQRTEDISKLPPVVGQQLLQLARVAYESLCLNRYIFTNLGEDFEHLGMMKKTTSLNVCTGPGCSYSFLHLTLLEYLSALHIVIGNLSVFELVDWLKEGSIVLRFLAGICRHDVYHNHHVYQELVQQLVPTKQNISRSLWSFPTIQDTSRSLRLVHCAYECPSIVDYIKNIKADSSVEVEPVVGLDWYATGYCISHFNHKWSLKIQGVFLKKENINLLIKGLKSSMASGPLSVQIDTVVLLGIVFDDDDEEVILQQLIGMIQLRRLVYDGLKCTNTFLSLLFQHPSIQSLELHLFRLDNDTELQLPHCNTSLVNLTTYSFDLCQLAKLILDCTSLNYLEITEISYESALPVLINIVQSHPSLEILKIGDKIECDYGLSPNLLDLVEAAAGNSRLKSLILPQFDYDNLPSHLQKPPVVDTFH